MPYLSGTINLSTFLVTKAYHIKRYSLEYYKPGLVPQLQELWQYGLCIIFGKFSGKIPSNTIITIRVSVRVRPSVCMFVCICNVHCMYMFLRSLNALGEIYVIVDQILVQKVLIYFIITLIAVFLYIFIYRCL